MNLHDWIELRRKRWSLDPNPPRQDTSHEEEPEDLIYPIVTQEVLDIIDAKAE